MKRLLCILFLLCLVPSLCFAEQTDTLHTLWGIDIGAPVAEAVRIAQNETSLTFSPLLSADKTEIIFYGAKIDRKVLFLGCAIENVFIAPLVSSIPADDKTTAWGRIQVELNSSDAISMFGTFYESFCTSFGAPTFCFFASRKLGAEGASVEYLDFPSESNAIAQTIQSSVECSNSVDVSCEWGNIVLSFSYFTGSLSFRVCAYANNIR